MIFLTLPIKISLSVVVISVPTTAITYVCLPEDIKEQVRPFVKAFENKYAYFLVSKTHPIRGPFYYSASKIPKKQIDEYKEQLKEWKKSSTSFYQSPSDLFTRDGRKNYKCAIPIFNVVDRNVSLKIFDTDCQIFSISNTVKKTSEILDGNNNKKLTEIKEKLHIDYNKMYVLKVNLKNIDKFIFTLDLVVDIVDYDTDEITNDKNILSLELNNQYIDSWRGKVNSILVTGKFKTDKTLDDSHKKTCITKYNLSFNCLALNFDSNDSKNVEYEKLKISVESKIKNDNKYVVHFLSNKFNYPNSTKLKANNEYKYTQLNNTSEEELMTFTYLNPMVGFVDFENEKNTQLFVLDKPNVPDNSDE